MNMGQVVKWTRSVCIFAPLRHKKANKRCCGPDADASLLDYLSFLLTYSLMQNISSCLPVMETPQPQGTDAHQWYARYSLVFIEYGAEVAKWWRPQSKDQGYSNVLPRPGCHAPQQQYVRGPIITTSHCKLGLEKVYFEETAGRRTWQATSVVQTLLHTAYAYLVHCCLLKPVSLESFSHTMLWVLEMNAVYLRRYV
jgi:hypothetical protein